MKHRLLAGLMCLTLLLGLMPAGVGAANTPNTPNEVVTYAWEDMLLEDIPMNLEDDPEAPAEETPAETPEELPEDPETPRDPDPEPQPQPSVSETPQPSAAPAEPSAAPAEPAPAPEAPAVEEPSWKPEDESFTIVDYEEAIGLYALANSYDEATTRELNGEVLRKGIDVSQWQYSIDWARVAASGVEFAFVRVGYRGGAAGTLGVDGYYQRNITEARKYGIKVGAYIFSQAITVAEGVEEARYAMKLLEDAGLTLDLPLVIDYEFYGRLNSGDGLSRQTRTDICNAFCREVESRGYDSMVYANYSMLANHMNASQLTSRVWLAHYTTQTGYPGDYEYWQFSSTGRIPGISGNVDLDFWFDFTGPFMDVRPLDWFQEAVTWAYDNGIMNGFGNGRFEPNGGAQRAQVVTVLYRALGDDDGKGSMPFLDVPLDAYYTMAVGWAYKNAYVTGVTEKSFSPLTPIKRQDLVRILYRISESPEPEQALEGFSDADKIDEGAIQAMTWAVEQGLISGYEDGTLRPQGNLTRAELCTIVRNYMQSELYESGSADEADPDSFLQ